MILTMRVRGYPAGVPCWVELSTPDPAGAVDFYRGLLGWTAEDIPVLRHGGRAVAGVRQGPADRPAGWVSYVATEDTAATADSVTSAGGMVLSPVADVEPGARTALFADPSGAVFGAWQRDTFGGAQVVNELGTVCWTDLVTNDLAGAETFYRDVFGWDRQVGDYADDYFEFTCAGRPVAGMRAIAAPLPPGTPCHWSVTLLVEDCETTAARCAELGGSVVLPPIDAGVGTYAALAGPYGAVFGTITLIPELLANFL